MRRYIHHIHRAAVLFAVLAPTPGAASLRATELPTLLCARDEVLRIVDRTVRGWNQYNRIEEGTAAEAPTTIANAVVCHITLRSIAYELTTEGWVARPVQEVRRYDVRVIHNRLFVWVLP